MLLWSVLLSVWILREPLTRRRLAGVALGTLGMAVLIGGEMAKLAAAPVGALFMLAAAMSWALGTVLMKKFPIGMPTTVMTAWFMLLGGVPVFIGTVFIDHGSWHLYSAQSNFGVMYNMIVSFVFCYWAWFKIVEMAPASVASLSTLMVPVVGVFSGMAVLGEIPHWNDIAALLLVMAALATVLIASPTYNRVSKT
jgi:drug/metabolite transporter (DMT)-like permease